MEKSGKTITFTFTSISAQFQAEKSSLSSMLRNLVLTFELVYQKNKKKEPRVMTQFATDKACNTTFPPSSFSP